MPVKNKSIQFRVLLFLFTALVTGCRVIFITPPVDQTAQYQGTDSVQLTKTKTEPAPGADLTPAPTSATREPTPTLDEQALRGQTFTLAHPWIDSQAEAFNALVEQFNNSNTYGLTVQTVSYGGCQAMLEAYQTKGVTEDAAICWKSDLLSASISQAWSPLESSAAGVISEPAFLYNTDTPLGQISASVAVSNGQTVLPLAFNPGLIFYNQTWASELGFADPPLTLTDLRAQMNAALQALLADEDWYNNGAGGLLLSKTPLSALSWYFASDGTLPVREGLPAFDHDALKDSFVSLKGLYSDDLSWVGSQNTPWQYFARRYALAYEGSLSDLVMQEDVFKTTHTQDQWITLPYPTEDGTGSIALESLGFAVKSTDISRQTAAWMFARWLLSSEIQESFTKVHGLWPAIGSPANIAPVYSAQHPAFAAAIFPQVRIQAATEDAHWLVSRLLLQDAYQRLYDLEEAYFPQVFEMLDSMLLEMGRK